MKIFRLIIFISLIGINWASAQKADSTRKEYTSSSVRLIQLKDLYNDTITFRDLDTTSFGFQNFNYIHADNIPRFYLGNLGLAHKSFVVEDNLNWGFDNGRHAHDLYLKKIDDLKFYRVNSPHTNLYYIWNRRKEQLFNLTFAQNIGPRFNYAVNFTRLVSLGDYNRQNSDHLKYDVSLWYTDKSRRYQAFAAIINNDLSLEENGGIKNDSIFTVGSDFNSEFEEVNLNNASTKISDKHYFIKQTYAFGAKDDLVLDSITIRRIRPKLRMFHELRINNRKDTYKETPLDTGVYANIYIDSVNTNDEISFLKIENRFGLEYYFNNKIGKRSNYISAYVRNDQIKYKNLSIDSNLNSISINADAKVQLNKSIEWVFNVSTGLIGDYSDNNLIRSSFNYYMPNDSNYFQLSLFSRNNDQALMYNRYVSNHHEWQNNFEDHKTYSIKLSYYNTKRNFSTAIVYKKIQNELYFDTSFVLRNLTAYNYYQFNIQKLFKLGHFYLNNIIYVQNTDQSSEIRLPLLHTYQSLYYQGHLFKKALFLRTGFDVRYYTKTASYAYDASTAQFNLDNRELGDYPLIDFFVTATLKRAVLMLKVDHLNQGMFNRGSYYVFGHPIPDRGLKVGLRWAFYD